MVFQATLLMIRVHDLRLTEAAGFSDAMSFANAVAKRYKNQLENFFNSRLLLGRAKITEFVQKI